MYNSSILNRRGTILVPEENTYKGTTWTTGRTVWCGVDFVRGKRALMQGDVTAYESVIIRMAYHADIDKMCRLKVGDKYYAFESFNADEEQGEIQVVGIEVEDMDI